MRIGWKKYKIEDIITGLFDGPHATPTPSESGPIFLGIKNLTDDGRFDLSEIRHISENDFSDWTRRVIPSIDDLVFTYEATLNRYGLIQKGMRCCLGRRMGLLRLDKSVVYPKFLLYYFFTSEWRQVINQNLLVGATVNRIPISEFPKFPINLPKLSEQISIAKVLSDLDSKIELNNKINAELEGMAKLIYEYWFVQFDFPFDFAQGKPADDSSNSKDVKPYKSSGGKMVWNTELKREIPEGWEVKTLDSVCERIQSGGTPLTSNKTFYIGDLNWFTTKELQDEYLIDSESTISENAIEESSAKIFDANTIVIAIYAAPTVGRIGVLTKRSAFNQACCGLTPGKSISTEYLFQTLLLYRNKLNVLATGTTQKNLGVGTIKNQKIVIPQEMVFNKYSSTVTKLFDKKRTIVYENQQLSSLRDWLLPMLMNGQVKVNQD